MAQGKLHWSETAYAKDEASNDKKKNIQNERRVSCDTNLGDSLSLLVEGGRWRWGDGSAGSRRGRADVLLHWTWCLDGDL